MYVVAMATTRFHYSTGTLTLTLNFNMLHSPLLVSYLLKSTKLNFRRGRYKLPRPPCWGHIWTSTREGISSVSAVYAAKPNYSGSKPDNMKAESEDKNTETWLRSGSVCCTGTASKVKENNKQRTHTHTHFSNISIMTLWQERKDNTSMCSHIHWLIHYVHSTFRD